jgi:invasion protein IalB
MKQGTLLKKLVKMSIDDKQIHARESTTCENSATYPNHDATIRSFKSKVNK